jgi:hypothetical protein
VILSAGVGFAAANLAVKGFTDQIAVRHYAPAAAYLIAAAGGSMIAVLSQMTAFQRYRAIDVVPVAFALPILLPTVLGLLILEEHWSTAASQAHHSASGRCCWRWERSSSRGQNRSSASLASRLANELTPAESPVIRGRRRSP